MYAQNRWCTKQLLTTCQLVPNQYLSSITPQDNSPQFYVFSHDVIWYAYPFDKFSSAVLVLYLPRSLCPPSPSLAGQYEKLKN